MKDRNKIKKAFEQLFEFSDKNERIDHEARMLSYAFLSEVEKFMERKAIKQTKLAELVGTSSSYLTQLFRGDRLLNLKTLAKMQDALGVKFIVKAIDQSTSIDVDTEKIVRYLNKPPYQRKKSKPRGTDINTTSGDEKLPPIQQIEQIEMAA